MIIYLVLGFERQGFEMLHQSPGYRDDRREQPVRREERYIDDNRRDVAFELPKYPQGAGEYIPGRDVDPYLSPRIGSANREVVSIDYGHGRGEDNLRDPYQERMELLRREERREPFGTPERFRDPPHHPRDLHDQGLHRELFIERRDIPPRGLLDDSRAAVDRDPYGRFRDPMGRQRDVLEHSTVPFDRQRDPLDRSRDPMDRSRDPMDRSRDPLDRPRDPLDRPRDPLDRPRDPMDRPRDPMDRQRDPLDRPRDPLARPRDPLDRPREPLDRPRGSLDRSRDVDGRDRYSERERKSRYSHEPPSEYIRRIEERERERNDRDSIRDYEMLYENDMDRPMGSRRDVSNQQRISETELKPEVFSASDILDRPGRDKRPANVSNHVLCLCG